MKVEGMEQKEKVIGYSGGADEIGFLFGVADYNREVGETFVSSHGISSGAIIVFMEMCGRWDHCREVIHRFNVKDHIFGYNPFSLRGVLIALGSIVKADSGLWHYGKLEETLRDASSEDMFNDFCGNNKRVVWVGVSDDKGGYENVKLNNLTYNEALRAVIQSSSLQLITKQLGGKGDGGLVNHIGTEFIAERYDDCDIVSVFARTEEFNKKMPRKFLSKIGWVLNRLFFGISHNNETETDKMCEKRGNKNMKHFMTEDVIEGIFTIKEGDNAKLYNMGYHSKVK